MQPWTLDPQSIEGYEDIWKTANNRKHAFLPFKSKDDQGRDLQRPMREQPPIVPEALIKGRQMAETDLMMVTGQYQAQMGENENAKSGKAISERQAQGDNATYHFNDGFAGMVRAIGKMLVDLIPKVYDTERIVKILAEDDSEQEIHVDPNAKQAFDVKKSEEDGAIRAIFNPNVGTYDVEADMGPDFATRRQEAENAFTQLMAANKDLTLVIADIAVKNMDFPGADELAARLKRMVPPQALGTMPSPQLQQQIQELTKQNTHLMSVVSELTKLNAENAIKLKGKDELRDIDAYAAGTKAYEAETKRIEVEAKARRETHDTARIAIDAAKAARGLMPQDDLDGVRNANEKELESVSDE